MDQITYSSHTRIFSPVDQISYLFLRGLTHLQWRSKHSARSHPKFGKISSKIRLDLIHNRLDIIHTRLDLIHTRLDLIHTRLDLIHTQLDLIHIRLDLIHYRLDLIHLRLDLIHSRLCLIHTRLDLIQNSARSHPPTLTIHDFLHLRIRLPILPIQGFLAAHKVHLYLLLN